MSKNINILAAILLSVFHFSSSAEAACFSGNNNERLENFCLLQEINQSSLSYNIATLVDARLKREGYLAGLGLATPAKNISGEPKFSLNSSLQYENDINGGNPKGNLILGNLVFEGQPEFYRKNGVLGRLNLGVYSRYVYGEGRYLSYSSGVGYAYSPQYDLSIKTAGAVVCSKNHISNWWYIDGCARTSKIVKEISEEHSSSLSLTASHLYSQREKGYGQITFGINRHFDDSYVQNQFIFGVESISGDNMAGNLYLTVGEKVEGELTTRISLTGSVSKIVGDKPLTLSVSVSQSKGGKLLGFERDERLTLINVSYPIWKNLSLSLGYPRLDSSIDYFDESSPVIGFQFNPIQF